MAVGGRSVPDSKNEVVAVGPKGPLSSVADDVTTISVPLKVKVLEMIDTVSVAVGGRLVSVAVSNPLAVVVRKMLTELGRTEPGSNSVETVPVGSGPSVPVGAVIVDSVTVTTSLDAVSTATVLEKKLKVLLA